MDPIRNMMLDRIDPALEEAAFFEYQKKMLQALRENLNVFRVPGHILAQGSGGTLAQDRLLTEKKNGHG